MTGLIAFLLPPAVGLLGMRLVRLVLRPKLDDQLGLGLRFATGLSAGMLLTTQIVLLWTLAGVRLAGLVSRIALIWGSVEFALLFWRGMKRRRISLQVTHAWLLLLLPLLYYFWVFGRMSVVEGAMEFDGVTYWLFKAKVLYLKSGQDFLQVMHMSRLSYAHWDYPWLVPALYTLTYGAAGEVNEFLVKVWPCWMILALCLAILSSADAWRRPRPLPIAAVLLVCLLPGTLFYIHREGGTIPMLFHACLAMLLVVRAWTKNEVSTLAAAAIVLTGCAMTKFEGMIYAGLWLLALLPICWRRGWLRNWTLVRALGLAALCVLPYVVYRFERPVLHPESGWIKMAVDSPGLALARLPVIAGIGLSRCFLNQDFAYWIATPEGRLQWAGTWCGLTTFSQYLVHGLPTLTLGLLAFSLWRRNYRRPALALTGVVLGVFLFLAFVLACLAQLFPPDNEAAYVIAKTGDDMSRYMYPFLMAWFLGIMSLRLEAPPLVSDAPCAHT